MNTLGRAGRMVEAAYREETEADAIQARAERILAFEAQVAYLKARREEFQAQLRTTRFVGFCAACLLGGAVLILAYAAYTYYGGRGLAFLWWGRRPLMPGLTLTEKPILFSGPMVKAILEGHKTQTRRAVKHYRWHYKDGSRSDRREIYHSANIHEYEMAAMMPSCPYGYPDETRIRRLWVRETHALIWTDKQRGWHCVYAADGIPEYLPKGEVIQWTPSIHMPRVASRITLELCSINAERVQEISGQDALAGAIPHR